MAASRTSADGKRRVFTFPSALDRPELTFTSFMTGKVYVLPGECASCRSRCTTCENWIENLAVEIERPMPSFCEHLQQLQVVAVSESTNESLAERKECKYTARGAPFRVALDWIHPVVYNLQKPEESPIVEEDEAPKASKPLPEDVAEKILAMVSYVFKARMLSKAWNVKFSSSSSQVKSLFLKQIALRSAEWRAFCPVFGSYKSKSWTAYDRTSQTWRSLPSLSFLPVDIPIIESSLSLNGPLLSGVVDDGCGDKFFVSNVLTKDWKVLPPCPIGGDLLQYKLISDCSDTYSMVAFFSISGGFRRPLKYEAGVYRSDSNTWKCSKLNSTAYLKEKFPLTFLNGTIYMFVTKVHFLRLNPLCLATLMAFSVENGTWEEVDFTFAHREASWPSKLLVCAGKLMVVTSTAADVVLVLKVDVLSRDFEEVVRGPPTISDFCQPVADGDCIYFNDCVKKPVLTYNAITGDWKRIPAPPRPREAGHSWISSSVDLRLNPFLGL